MRIVAISDTHGVDVGPLPDGDVLVHCGDMLAQGTLANLRGVLKVLSRQTHRHVVIIAGNHDHAFARHASTARAMVAKATRPIHYIKDSGVELDGVRFWGSPWTPNFFPENWVFNQPRRSVVARARWAKIPDDTDVLLTHGPAWGVLDACPDFAHPERSLRVGCEALADRIATLRSLKLHCFGHIHEGRGDVTLGGLLSVNAASLNRHYRPWARPYTVIDIDSRGARVVG